MLRFVLCCVTLFAFALVDAEEREYWGALSEGQSTPNTERVVYPRDIYGLAWNFRNAETALKAAMAECRNQGHNCDPGFAFAFSTSATQWDQFKVRCLTVWTWPNPMLSGLYQVGWTEGEEVAEHFRDKEVEDVAVACNHQ